MAGHFALVDCARDPKLIKLVKRTPAHACLFAGNMSPEVEAVSPFLVDLAGNQALSAAWQQEGWGRSWGLFLRSAADLETLRRHFRHFLLAQLPDGEKVMFRFYDPRVLRVFLPSCDAAELQQWFAHVEAFVVEDEAGGATTYGFDGAGLMRSEGASA